MAAICDKPGQGATTYHEKDMRTEASILLRPKFVEYLSCWIAIIK